MHASAKAADAYDGAGAETSGEVGGLSTQAAGSSAFEGRAAFGRPGASSHCCLSFVFSSLVDRGVGLLGRLEWLSPYFYANLSAQDEPLR